MDGQARRVLVNEVTLETMEVEEYLLGVDAPVKMKRISLPRGRPRKRFKVGIGGAPGRVEGPDVSMACFKPTEECRTRLRRVALVLRFVAQADAVQGRLVLDKRHKGIEPRGDDFPRERMVDAELEEPLAAGRQFGMLLDGPFREVVGRNEQIHHDIVFGGAFEHIHDVALDGFGIHHARRGQGVSRSHLDLDDVHAVLV